MHQPPSRFTLDRTNLALAAIVLVGLALRLYNLGGESLWLDETTSAMLTRRGPLSIIVERAKHCHAPLYFLILDAWAALFGRGEFALRLPSAIFGITAIPWLYRLASYVGGRRVGLLAALLLAVSPFHVFYSQEARMYSLAALLAIASMYYFLRLAEGRPGGSLRYYLSTLLLLLSHNSGLIILAIQNLYCLLIWRSAAGGTVPEPGAWKQVQKRLLGSYALWVWFPLLYVVRAAQKTPALDPAIGAVLVDFFRLCGSPGLCWLFLAVLGALGIQMWRNAEADGGRRGQLTLLLTWLLAPSFALFAISKLVAPIYLVRYVIISLPALYILVAVGIMSLGSRLLAVATLTAALALTVSPLAAYYEQTDKEQWREAAAMVQAQARPGDLVIIHADFCKKAFEHYFRRSDVERRPFKYRGGVIGEAEATQVFPLMEGHDRVWLVLNRGKDRGLLRQAMAEKLSPRLHRGFYKIDVYLYEGPPGPERKEVPVQEGGEAPGPLGVNGNREVSVSHTPIQPPRGRVTGEGDRGRL
jgi:mannosyltransferase